MASRGTQDEPFYATSRAACSGVDDRYTISGISFNALDGWSSNGSRGDEVPHAFWPHKSLLNRNLQGRSPIASKSTSGHWRIVSTQSGRRRAGAIG